MAVALPQRVAQPHVVVPLLPGGPPRAGRVTIGLLALRSRLTESLPVKVVKPVPQEVVATMGALTAVAAMAVSISYFVFPGFINLFF